MFTTGMPARFLSWWMQKLQDKQRKLLLWGNRNDFYYVLDRALDPLTGEWKWEYRVQPKSTSGLLTTASNQLFGGGGHGELFCA